MSSDNNSEMQDTIVRDTQFNEVETHLDEREKIKQEISTMTFEELQRLKQKIGIKLYNATIFGANSKPKTDFKRVNKNRPREMSSKTRIKIRNGTVQVKKSTLRDPRFDPLCGTFNESTFKENYKFIYDLRKKEYKQLENELRSTEDSEEKTKIKQVMQRLGNQIREHDKREKEKEKTKQEKLDIRTKLKKGEKPIFKKKSDKKLENLIGKYEELKKSNKLQKHIEKRSRKLNLKDRK